MSDNTDLRGRQDRERVNPNEPYELRYLEERFGVLREQVLQAIHEVGDNREKVEEYLRNIKSKNK